MVTNIRRADAGGSGQQLCEGPEVARIPGIDVAAALALRCFQLRCFEEHRQFRETAVVQQHSKRLEPEASLADVLVTIDTAAAGLLGVVQVKGLDAAEPNDAIELSERRAIALRDRKSVV